MKKVFFLLIICVPFLADAQNFLLNGGFEDENTCTEFQVECAPEAWLTNDDGFSNYFKDANRSHQSLHCMAIEAGHAKKPFKRTFIRSQLACGLRKGSQYRINFFVKSLHAILDSIGIYFSSYDFLFDNRPLQNIIPSAYLTNGNSFIAADTSWQNVTIDYTANGDESFFTIANFSKRDITGPTGIELENNFFVFIDDISLVPIDIHESLCDDWQKRKTVIYDQNERHEFLRKKIKDGKVAPPIIITIPRGKLTLIDTLLLPDIFFATGKSTLQAGSDLLLDSFCKKIVDKQIDSIVVEGHTDSAGKNELNEHLSLARAETVNNYFIKKGLVKPQQVIARGLASHKPVASNSNPEGRRQNRRVEIFVYRKQNN